MKRVLIVILAAMMLFCACGQTESSDEVRQISWDSNFCNDGALLLEQIGYYGQVLKFIDFKSMQSAVICPRPNCRHDDPETCSAFGMDNGPTLYGTNIYFFEVDNERRDEGYIDILKIVRANSDGTGRVTVKTIENRNSPYYDVRYLIGSKLYFTTVTMGYDDHGSTNNDSYYFCSYDLESGEYKEIAPLASGYGAGARIMGVYDGKMYINTSRRTLQEPIPWQNFMDIDFVASIEYDNYHYCYDLETCEFTETDLDVLMADGRYMLVENEDATVFTLYRPDGSTLDVTDTYSSYRSIVNDMMFVRAKKFIIDVKTGKRYNMITDDDVIYYIDGEYVLEHNQVDESGLITGTEYYRAKPEEIIGEEKE